MGVVTVSCVNNLRAGLTPQTDASKGITSQEEKNIWHLK
jgi:hypothetical protein